MARILHITSSPKGRASYTRKLGLAIIDKLKAKEVKEIDLLQQPFPHLTADILEAFHTPAAYRTPVQQVDAGRSENAIKELAAADVVVISVPMHNYTIPSALKAYIDHIVIAGVTFGLFKNKQAYIAFGAGWDFSHPELQALDFCVPYLKAVLSLIGINDITVFRLEGAVGTHQKEQVLNGIIDGMWCKVIGIPKNSSFVI